LTTRATNVSLAPCHDPVVGLSDREVPLSRGLQQRRRTAAVATRHVKNNLKRRVTRAGDSLLADFSLSFSLFLRILLTNLRAPSSLARTSVPDPFFSLFFMGHHNAKFAENVV
jgi:hypothetical protein